MKTILIIILTAITYLNLNGLTVYTVTSNYDPDPYIYPYDFDDAMCHPIMYGTLQWAIRKSLDTPDECLIVFDIPGQGPFTIFLNYGLPSIYNKSILIDATTQSGYSVDNPQIILNGNYQLGTGIHFNNVSGNCGVKGLYFKNFISQALLLHYTENFEISNNYFTENGSSESRIFPSCIRMVNSSYGNIKGNYIGVEPDGTEIGNSAYGMVLTDYSNNNTIGGISPGEGNKIINSGGIWITRKSNYNRISGNVIYGMGKAISLDPDGNQQKIAPEIIEYNGITGTIRGTSGRYNIIEIFGSTGDDRNESANEYLGTTQADSSGLWEISGIVTSFLSIVATATDTLSNTSELSKIKHCCGAFCFDQPGVTPCDYPPLQDRECNEKVICLGETVTFFFCEFCQSSSWSSFWDFSGLGLIDGFYSLNPTSDNWLWSIDFQPTVSGVGTIQVNLCTFDHIFILTVIELPPPSIIQSNILCQGGTTTLDAGAGYSNYSWNTGETTQTITISQPGIYSVTVTGANGCTATNSIDVTMSMISAAITQVSNVSCFNQCNGSATISPVNGVAPFSYLWSNGPSTPQANNLCTGTYMVTVTDNVGCSTVESVTITQPSQLTVSITSSDVLCNGGATGTATANGSGGMPPYLYFWSNSQNTQTVVSLIAGTYTVTVYDSNGCTAVNSVNITEPQPLSFTVTFVNPLCAGSADGSATVTVTGGTPYHWTFPLPPSNGYMFQWSDGIQSFIPAFSHTNTDMQSGFYTITITDANNCTAVASVTLSDPPSININLTANLPTCFGYSNGSINSVVSGGTAPYNYIWSTGQTTPDITGVSAGTYLLTVTDASGCTNISSILVTHPHELATTITGTSPLCFNGASGSVNLTVIGGTTPYIYIWSNGATTEDLNNVPGGFYSVTVTDIFGCTSTANLSVTEPPLLTAVITGTNVVCGNATGSVTVNANGGTSPYTYVWDDPPPAQTTQTCYGLTGGIWNVTVTDANGCTTSASFEISVVPPLFNVSGIVSQTDPCVSLCNGFIDLTVTPVGTYSFQWNDGINNFATTEDVSNLCNYQYYVTITDQSGCLITQSYNVPVIPGYPTGSNVYISGLTIINDNMQHPYAQNIFIQNGGTLIVDGIGTELQFLHHKKIIMQGGSTLIVRNGAKLNSYCLMWDGISAYSGSASNPVNISIETDGIVENAIWGIYANGYVNVNCTTAHFINNWIDIYLYQTRLQPYIANCEFITNIPILQYAPYYSTTYKYPFAHIRTYKIGVDYNKIIFNTFTNTNTFTDASYQGMGIYAQNSSFKNITYCNFNYLWYGINALTCQIRVEHNNFAGNNRGVLGSNSTTMLYSNTFNVSYNGNQNTMATYPYGASIQNCNNYQVQENTFQNGFAGLFMVNNPQTGKQIYKNTFDNLEFAFIANGTNGVKLTCNDFGLTAANNLRNIYMYNGSINSIQNHAVIAATPPYQSINTHNRFAIDKDTWPDSYKFSKNIASPGGYQYYWGVYNPPLVNDLTRIEPPTPFPNWANTISTPAYSYLASRCTSEINGGKSVNHELTKLDTLKTALTYQQNYYNALVDDGNTEGFLTMVQNLQPNNFTQAYNQLMSASPYLSDTVLIAFMIHPINKPAHKKNLVLANSPLPYKVRPYIDEMNVNQNFKNQMWAAQTGLSARTELEHEIENRDFGINSIFGDLLISAVLVDTVPEKVDTLLNYVLQNGTLSERMLTSPLFIEKERYSDALNNLTEVSFLNETGNSQITDFIQLQLLKIQLAQAPDSIRDSLILINESWINPIAYDTTHFCMEDALNLLEGVYDTLYPRNVYVGSSPNTKKQPFISFKSDDYDCGLQIHPNPAHKYVNIVISKSESDANNELRLCDINGKVIQVYKEISEYIKIDLKNKNPGVYYLILMNKVSVVCSKKLVIE